MIVTSVNLLKIYQTTIALHRIPSA